MPESLIRIQNASKIYRTSTIQTTALAQINLDVNQGEFVACMGPSGCGKSTLLNLLGLLDPPDQGQYWFESTETSKLPERNLAQIRKRAIGIIFQSFNLIDELTVYQNIELPLLYQDLDRAQRKARVEEAMDRVAIAHRASHFPAQLSGGQQQRVAVGRAVVGKPALLLADEPTGNLDSVNGDEVMNLLAQLHREGSTIFMVTHTAKHADYASRVISMQDGKITSDLFRDVKAQVTL